MDDDKGLHVSDDAFNDKETGIFSRQPASHRFDKMEVGVLGEISLTIESPFEPPKPKQCYTKQKTQQRKKTKEKQEDSAQNKQVHHPS